MDTTTPATAAPTPTTATFRLTGDYGPFTVTRTITIAVAAGEDPEDVAFTRTGIGTDLEAAGWAIEFNDDADWTIERLS